MPNRMIKETIRTSKTVGSMTDFQFRLWTYLITYVDDYGRGSADAVLIKGFCFSRRKRVSESDIENGLAELAGMGCIHLYSVDGESYFYFPNWGEHQRIQTKKSKYPEPPPETMNSQKSTVSHRESPPETKPNQTNTLAQKFARFWEVYPKKRSKGDAEKAFKSINPPEQLLGAMIAAVERQKLSRDWQKDGGQFIPYPATWLRAKGWENEDGAQKNATWREL